MAIMPSLDTSDAKATRDAIKALVGRLPSPAFSNLQRDWLDLVARERHFEWLDEGNHQSSLIATPELLALLAKYERIADRTGTQKP